MGTYKVIQDIEAEDKLLGPLTFRQFIFGLIGVLFYYLSFLVATKHAAFLLVIFLPPALIATFFAWPWSSDQPTEVWALAKLRFLFKPRRRIWDQSGMKDLVTITAPKRVAEPMRTDGLSQHEVNSRLGALANTIDSRGWAIKNAAINIATEGSIVGGDTSDRLINASSLPQEVPTYEIQGADDILDEQNNPIAQQFDQMITASSRAHRQELLQMMNQPGLSLPAPISSVQAGALPAPAAQAQAGQPAADYWFMNANPAASSQQAASTTYTSSTPATAMPAATSAFAASQAGMVQAATPTAEEEAFAERLKAERAKPNTFANRMKTIQPLNANPAPSVAAAAVPVQPDPTLMQLATNNDLDVATIARQASKKDGDKHELGDNEVVVTLH